MAVSTKQKYDEDLFAETTMTFGEHLDELRQALFKALSGVVVGVLIGLCVGKYVVEFIKRPLEGALIQHYSNGGLEAYKAFSARLAERGVKPPYSVETIDTMIKAGLIFEIRYVHPDSVLEDLHIADMPKVDEARTATADGVAPKSVDVRVPDLDATKLAPMFLWQPVADDARVSIKALSATEAFSIWLKASLITGIVVASPWAFYHIWAFVAAGLYPHEKKYVYIFLPFSLGLFLLGVATAFFFVFEPVLNFLFSFNRWLGLDPDPRISEWLSFVLFLPIGFGISFQLPLVMLFLERIGVFDVQAYWEKWRIAILVIFILAALLTPADPYSMLLMAVPLTGLYFLGIGLCRYLPKSTSPLAA